MKLFSKISPLILIFFLACSSKKNDYVSLIVKVENLDVDSIYILNYDLDYKKAIVLNENSEFKDTLNIEAGIYNLKCGEEYTTLYLENGFELSITLDALEFDESITASGNGHEVSNYLFERMLKREAFWQEIEDRLLVLDSIQLNAFVNQFVNQEIQAMKSLEVDSNTLQQQLESITQSKEHYLIFITNELELRHFAETVKEAPHFSFADVNGIKRSLSDYRGKMIYLDVWASWCMPCLAEAPALSQLQQEYAESNLIFMGISLDCVRSDWKNAIDEHDLKGIQLVTDSCWESPFLSQYLITSIPRFFLIDQEGQFIDVDAPRPSSDEIGPLLDKYLHR